MRAYKAPVAHATDYHNRNHFTHREVPRNTWREGDIAFLKACELFSWKDHDALIASGYIPEKATCHPVIILKRSFTHDCFLITTVSAYSSGPWNGHLAPWNQEVHQWKRRDDFRSFTGSECVSNKYKPLKLEGNAAMPKPKASWLNIQNVWAVPGSVLGYFAKSPTLLRLEQESLKDLQIHISSCCKQWDFIKEDARFFSAPPEPRAAQPRPARPNGGSGTQHCSGNQPNRRRFKNVAKIRQQQQSSTRALAMWSAEGRRGG